MRILLAIDDSRFSEAATQAVMRLRSEGTELDVLHVIAPIDSSPSYSYAVHAKDIQAVQQTLEENARKLLAHAEQSLSRAGFEVHTTMKTGDPRATIVDFAASRKCDLIVMGSHGRRGLDRLLMGSVAEFVAHHASCSVEIIRIPAKAL
jgi:nucleotide-binding universal stress UspA family protein